MTATIDPNEWRAEMLSPDASLPDLRWSFPKKKKDTVGIRTQAVQIPAAEINCLVDRIARGSEQEASKAAKSLIQARQAQAAITPLLQIADGSRTKDHFRREAAIQVLGRIGGSQAAQGLVKIKKTPEYGPATCYALGCIGDPVAMPYLVGLIRDGYPIALNWNMSPQQEKDFSVVAHAYALMAIGLIGDPAAIPSLVLDVNKEFLSTKYSDESKNPLTNSSNLGLVIVGALYDSWKNSRVVARATAIMVDPAASLSSVMEFPGDSRQMWMYQFRVRILQFLAFRTGTALLTNCLPQTKQVMQRLMVALSMLEFDPESVQCVNILAEGARSAYNKERVLAYDGFIKQYGRTLNPAIIPWGTAGLNDRDKMVRGAVTASILFNRAEAWYPQVFEFLKSPSAETRVQVIIPLMLLAGQKDAHAISILESVMRNDKDKGIREWLVEFWADLPHAQRLYELENEYIPDENAELETEISEVEQADIPSDHPDAPAVVPREDQPIAPANPAIAQADETKADSHPNLFCMMCGFRLPEEALFCPQCGDPIKP